MFEISWRNIDQKLIRCIINKLKSSKFGCFWLVESWKSFIEKLDEVLVLKKKVFVCIYLCFLLCVVMASGVNVLIFVHLWALVCV